MLKFQQIGPAVWDNVGRK